MPRMRVAVLTGLTGLVVAAPAAQAHVTLNPRSVTANSFGRLDVRVPNERDEAGTKTVVLHFPHGFYSASTKRVWGWTARVSMRKLATLVPSADGDITEEVAKITFRARTKAGWIAPGQFEEFGLSMRIPNTPGRALAFPSTQTYSNKEVVRWIEVPQDGQEEPENPAPVLALSAATGDHHGAAGSSANGTAKTASEKTPAKETAAAAPADSSDTTARVLGVVGIVVGAAGVAYGVLAGRRRTAA